MKTFPTLYKLASTGDIQQWDIAVEGRTIRTSWGRKGGAIQVTEDTITEGKNIGKANETSPEEQALAEAQSTWEKKLKRGYVKTEESAQAGEVSDLITGGVWPMLAEKFRDYGDKIIWPCFSQYKFDGHRCIAMVDARGKCTLWSRTRKPILSMQHIVDAIERLGVKNVIADGELYNHDYKDNFEELTHFIKQTKPIPGCEVLQYHIFDMVSPEPFSQRLKQRDESFFILCGKNSELVPVETIKVADEDEAMLAFEHFLALGYEGAMLRNADGLYMGHPSHRSKDLQKIKKMLDDEFKVVDVKEGKGKMAGHAIFICECKVGTFDAKMKGKLQELKQYWEDPSRAVGRQLTVQYQGFYKTGKPRFPVALRFRNDI